MAHARLAWALVFAVAAVLAVPAGSAPPARGVFVPGESLGGVRLGMTQREVLDAWGPKHGVCTNCTRPTWYFNSSPFAPEGAGVIFANGRASHVFTLWKPAGWRSSDGLALGATEAEVTASLVVSEETQCDGYAAIVPTEDGDLSAYYVFRGELWGFGLLRPGLTPCL